MGAGVLLSVAASVIAFLYRELRNERKNKDREIAKILQDHRVLDDQRLQYYREDIEKMHQVVQRVFPQSPARRKRVSAITPKK